MKDKLDNILFDISNSPIIDNIELASAYTLIFDAFKQDSPIEYAGIWLYVSPLAQNQWQTPSDLGNIEHDTFIIYENEKPKYFAVLKSEHANALSNIDPQNTRQELNLYYLTQLDIDDFVESSTRHDQVITATINSEHIDGTKEDIKFVKAMTRVIKNEYIPNSSHHCSILNLCQSRASAPDKSLRLQAFDSEVVSATTSPLVTHTHHFVYHI